MHMAVDEFAVMGIVNVTPDSFSDGGLYLEPRAAVDHALELERAGAVILDIGGESTRPGALPVAEREEVRRVLPVIEALADSAGPALDRHVEGGGRRGCDLGGGDVGQRRHRPAGRPGDG